MAASMLLALLSLAAPQDPATTMRSVVRGTVLDGELRPLAGVAVAVVDDDVVDLAKALGAPAARTAADGTFRLAVEVRREPAPWLVLGGPRLATVMVRIDAEDLDLGGFAMAPGTNASGRVRDRDGAPVAGATVEITDLLDTRGFLQEQRRRQRVRCRTLATTGTGGIFRAPGMVQSAGVMRVSKDGFHDAILQPVALGDAFEVTLAPSQPIAGRVLDAAGAGVGEVQVQVGEAITTTGVDGSFMLSPRDPFAREVRASKCSNGRLVSARALLAAGRATVQLRLPAAGEAVSAIRVVALTPARRRAKEFTAYVAWHRHDEQRRPLPDAILLAPFGRGERAWTASAVGGVATVTGARIRDQDQAVIFVLADGCGLGSVEVPADSLGDEPVTVQLQYEVVVRGRVVDANGRPVAGAEVIPTQGLSGELRTLMTAGMRSTTDFAGAPTGARTDADGRYELRCMPACSNNDLLVHAPGRAALPFVTLNLKAGSVREDLDFSVPDSVTLRGRFEGALPAGAQVFVQWPCERPSTSPSPREFAAAVPIDANGSFTIHALQPQQYMVQLFAPAPPRGGQCMRLPAGRWQGTDDRVSFAVPESVVVRGRVDGPVPWSRLAVAAMHQDGSGGTQGAFQVNGPVALVQRDRTYRIVTPPGRCDLLLFDVLAGVPLEWHRVDHEAGQGLDFAGGAEPVVLRLEPGEAAARAVDCIIAWLPEDKHWPSGVGNLGVQRLRPGEVRGNMFTDARAGDTVQLWVPARSGALLIRSRDRTVSTLALDQCGTGPVTVRIPAPAER